MSPSTTPSTAATAPGDEDLAEQARPGYGIPSQDPRTGAQTALEPEDAEREAHSALMGGGILTHGLPWLHHAAEAALRDGPALWQAAGPLLVDAAAGIIAGLAVLAVVSLASRLRRGAAGEGAA